MGMDNNRNTCNISFIVNNTIVALRPN